MVETYKKEHRNKTINHRMGVIGLMRLNELIYVIVKCYFGYYI